MPDKEPQLRFLVAPGIPVYLAILLLVLPLPWLGAIFFSIFLHEAGHICALLLLGEQITGISVGHRGITIQTRELGPLKELLCTLAGPASCILPLFLARWFPRTAVCAWIQTVYNLLPLYPLDGGRALHCLFSMYFSANTAEKLCRLVSYPVLAALLIMLLFSLRQAGMLSILLPAVLMIRFIRGNKTCKPGQLRVQ